jgi:predicted YcjX-like family ATPase
VDAEIKAMSAIKRTLKKIVESVELHQRALVLDMAQREIDIMRLRLGQATWADPVESDSDAD